MGFLGQAWLFQAAMSCSTITRFNHLTGNLAQTKISSASHPMNSRAKMGERWHNLHGLINRRMQGSRREGSQAVSNTLCFFMPFFFFPECSCVLKSAEQFSEVNVILWQTGWQLPWKVNPSLRIQITGSITKSVLAAQSCSSAVHAVKATDSISKCCESTSASFCLQRETLPQPHHWAHGCWDPCFTLKNKAPFTYRPPADSSLSPHSTGGGVSTRRQFSRRNTQKDPWARAEPGSALNKLSCFQHRAAISPSMGTQWQVVPHLSQQKRTGSQMNTSESKRIFFFPKNAACTSSICLASAAILQWERAEQFQRSALSRELISKSQHQIVL